MGQKNDPSYLFNKKSRKWFPEFANAIMTFTVDFKMKFSPETQKNISNKTNKIRNH